MISNTSETQEMDLGRRVYFVQQTGPNTSVPDVVSEAGHVHGTTM